MNNTSSAIYSVLEWITKFAFINLLWVLFTLAGGIILGFFPATTAMFAVIREWLRGNTEIPVFASFWNYFRNDFWKSNRLGIFITVIAILFGVDIFFINGNMNDLLTWTYIPLFAFMFLFILFIFYIFPVFVHFDLKVFQLIKHALLIMLINPLNTFVILLCLGSIYFIMQLLPALAFIFGGSAFAFITMWMALNAFHKIEKRQGNRK